MANNVFANGLEIACKAGDGKSIASFPDVCFTPPPPPAGFIPIPYANTAYAKDTSNASKTVFISNKPIMKKDVSFFKTSTGNEPAAGPMGIVSHVKKGKAYFTSWSMNVKIEGENVCRHTDGMTHNHGSKPGNTGVWHFFDTAFFGDPCKKEFQKVEKACGGMVKKKVNKKTKWVDAGKSVKWKKKHCDGLLSKPYNLKNMPDKESFLKELNEKLKRLNGVDEVIKKTEDAVMDKLTEMGLKFGAKQVVKKVPIAGWIWQAASLSGDIEKIKYMKYLFDSAKEEAERMTNQVKNLRKDMSDLKKKMIAGDYKGSANQLSDWTRTAATVDNCTRARKCMLVPMKDTLKKSGGIDDNKGCCPGQTGHHIIPGSYFKKNKGKKPCKRYNYKEASVVCAEGTSDTNGSHGAAHLAMNRASRSEMDNETEELSYEDARDAAVKSHIQAFPMSLCSPGCISSQLDKYHKEGAKCDDDTQLNFVRLGPADTGSQKI